MTGLVLRISTPDASRVREVPIVSPVEEAEARAWMAASADRWASLGVREIVPAGGGDR